MTAQEQIYNVGDFVVPYHAGRSTGIVRSIFSPDKIEVRTFREGILPVDETFVRIDIRAAKLEESIARLQLIHQSFEEEFKRGGLLGAVAARKQYHLDQLLENINKKMPVPDALNQAHLEPSTGVYVVAGNYSDSGLCLEEKRMQGLVISHEPKIAYEADAAILLKILFPKTKSRPIAKTVVRAKKVAGQVGLPAPNK